MKKLTLFVTAIAMCLGFTQCKKEQTPKFEASSATTAAITVGGMYNEAAISFGTTPGITPTATTGGVTLLPKAKPRNGRCSCPKTKWPTPPQPLQVMPPA